MKAGKKSTCTIHTESLTLPHTQQVTAHDSPSSLEGHQLTAWCELTVDEIGKGTYKLEIYHTYTYSTRVTHTPAASTDP